MTIKSIRVHQKFVIGEIWFNTESGYPEEVEIGSKPYPGYEGNGWKIKLICRVYGTETNRFLGDIGAKGFAYDDRPCKLVRTLEEATQTIKAFDDWSMNLDHHF